MQHRFLIASAFAAMLLAMTEPSPAHAQGAQTGYACAFPRGTSQAYAKGRYRPRPAKPITMEIAAIDLPAQRAELITPDGKGVLRIVLAVGANHFLEVVTEGYLNITTIYAKDEKQGTYPAVHSRHFGLFGEPLIAQYTGACQAK